MKILYSILFVGLFGTLSYSQSNTQKNEEKVEITKKDGQTKVTVHKKENGVETIEEYTGQDAENYINNMGKKESSAEDSFGSILKSFNLNSFDLDMDSIMNMSFFNFFDDADKKEFQKEVEEAMRQIGGGQFKMQMNFDFDSLASGMSQMLQGFDIDTVMQGNEISGLEEMLNSLGVTMDFHDKNSGKNTAVYVIKSRLIKIEDYNDDVSSSNQLQIEEFDIFPNPTAGSFKISYTVPTSDKAEIKIIDLNGKTIYKNSTTEKGKHSIDINLDNTTSGTYIVTLSQNGKMASKKVVVE